MKIFNTTAICLPDKHYMVDLTSRLEQITSMVNAGQYFTINRARQYGKTTTLHLLADQLKKEYKVVSLDFQKLGDSKFRSENAFARAFAVRFDRAMRLNSTLSDNLLESLDSLKTASQQSRIFEIRLSQSHWL